MRSRRPPPGGAAAALLLLLLAATTAWAQTPTRDEPFPVLAEARYWGPFLVDWGFEVQNIGYTDNVFLSSPASGVPEQSDWYVRAGPSVDVQLRLGRTAALTFYDQFIYEAYVEFNELNHYDNLFRGQFDLMLGPLLLTTSVEDLTYQELPSIAVNSETANPEILEPTRYRSSTLRQGARLFLGPQWDLYAVAGRAQLRYTGAGTLYTIVLPDGTFTEVPVEQALDRDRFDGRAEIGWLPRSGLRFFLGYERADIEFVYNIADRDSRIDREFIGVELRPEAKLSGELSIGRATLKTDDPDAGYTPYDGPISRARVTWTPSGATRATLTYNKDIAFSLYYSNLYYRSTGYGLDLEYFIGSRWGVQLTVDRDTIAYPEKNPDSSSAAIPGQRRKDRIWNYYLGLLRRFGGGLQIGIGYGIRDRDSNDPFAVDRQGYFSTTGGIVF